MITRADVALFVARYGRSYVPPTAPSPSPAPLVGAPGVVLPDANKTAVVDHQDSATANRTLLALRRSTGVRRPLLAAGVDQGLTDLVADESLTSLRRVTRSRQK